MVGDALMAGRTVPRTYTKISIMPLFEVQNARGGPMVLSCEIVWARYRSHLPQGENEISNERIERQESNHHRKQKLLCRVRMVDMVNYSQESGACRRRVWKISYLDAVGNVRRCNHRIKTVDDSICG